MIIEIDAMDTLFFKDGKPFSMGEETWADGIFPPYPSTIYGALRSKYFSEHIEDLSKANEAEDPTKDLKIRHIILKDYSGNIYFHLPKDFLKRKNENWEEVYRSKLIEDNSLSNNKLTHRLIPFNQENIFNSLEDGLFDLWGLSEYLEDSNNRLNYNSLVNFIDIEPKVGISRSKHTHTSEEGKLYRVGMKRLKNIKIIVEFEDLDLPETGFLKLGGEGKTVAYHICEKDEVSLPQIDKYFKLYLATPTIFKNGWLPDWIDSEKLEGTIPETNLKVQLLTAATGKPLKIGGFDMKARKPKKMFKAVPAGSVYFFKILSGNKEDLKKIHGKSISQKRKNEGFGISYIGKFNLEENK
mgnify:CR=1 FL=1